MAPTCSSGSAERLVGAPVRAVAPGGRGGNNRLSRVEAVDGRRFALKSYPATAGDDRDRLGVEFAALTFLKRHGVAEVPTALARDDRTGEALYEWIEGEPVTAPTAADIDAALCFAGRLHRLRRSAGAEALGWASEACTGGARLVHQTETRLRRLGEVATRHRGLGEVLDRAGGDLATYRGAALGFGDLADEARTLSPADFGFHNALRRPDGGLVFLDFEYFGWDDPVKLAAEFDLHPGMSLPPELSARWRDGIGAVYDDVPGFDRRLAAFRPLFALRWALIVLNEFLPERWARRQAAGATDAEAARARQLDKARTLLAKVSE